MHPIIFNPTHKIWNTSRTLVSIVSGVCFQILLDY